MLKASTTHKKVNQIEVEWNSCLDTKLCKYESVPYHGIENIFSQPIVILSQYDVPYNPAVPTTQSGILDVWKMITVNRRVP